MYTIEKSSKKALHIQLYEQMREDIVKNYKVGQKLPSIRKTASEYALSKISVESAYRQLYAEGYVESVAKSGYFVSDMEYKFLRDEKEEPKREEEVKKLYKYDFFPAQLSRDSFPLKLWKRLYSLAVDSSLDFGSYHDGRGDLSLREEIVKYLAESRGVRCSSEQVVVCSGFSDAMGLLAKLVKSKYEYFGMENPGYHVARRVFEEYGYKVERISVKKGGLDVEEFKKSKAKLLYITPSHQYPTGVVMPVDKRLKLLERVHQVDGLIIEDDYDSELSYVNRPIPALQALDVRDSVVYMGTFAKSLSPALRVSYMVLPKQLLSLYSQSYDAHFARVSLTTQKTLSLFMSEGHWQKHIRKIRTLNKKKHNLMRDILLEKLGENIEIVAQGGGLAILINPRGAFNWEFFKQKAEEDGIKLYFAKERCGGDFEAIRMGFGGFLLEELEVALDAFCELFLQAKEA